MYGIPGETPAMTRKMEKCVEKVMSGGKSKASAIAICKTTLGYTKKDLSEHKDVFVVHNKGKIVDLGDNKFKKQLLRFGSWLYGDDIFKVDKKFAESLIKNFKERVLQNIPLLRGHHTQNEAESNPDLVAGWVNDLEVGDDGVYAVFEANDDAVGDLGTVYKDVSASIDPFYVDHESGDEAGPVLSHVALVIEPYIKGLKSFQKMLSEEANKNVISVEQDDGTKIISQNPKMDKDKDKVVDPEVKEEVEAKAEESEAKTEEVEEAVEEPEEEIAEEKPAEESKEEAVEEPAEEEKVEEKQVEAEAEAETEEETNLSEEVEKLRAELASVKKAKLVDDAEAKYSLLLSEGKIVPAQKDSFIELYCAKESKLNLSDGKEKSVRGLFKRFLKHLPKAISFEEKGATSKEDEPDAFKPEDHFSESEIAGFKTLYKDNAEEKMKEAVELDKEMEEKVKN